jgi:predicted nucleic acid-binding protein
MPDPIAPDAVVLDTNIIVAAGFSPRSASARLVDAVARGRLRMPWSDATRREIERVVRRIPPLRGRDPAPLFRPEARVDALMDAERFALVPDPDDRPFAALAAASGATLVSNDEHLLGVRDRIGVMVRSSGECWRIVERESDRGDADRL